MQSRHQMSTCQLPAGRRVWFHAQLTRTGRFCCCANCRTNLCSFVALSGSSTAFLSSDVPAIVCEGVMGHYQFTGQAQAVFIMIVAQSVSAVQPLKQLPDAVQCLQQPKDYVATCQISLGIPHAQGCTCGVCRELDNWTPVRCELNDKLFAMNYFVLRQTL